jgi:hypothetical protein
MVHPMDKEFGMASDVKTRRNSFRFYSVRQWIYGGLLLFIAVVGLPMIGVPKLHDRLSERVSGFKRAMLAENIVPVTLRVGENTAPFPAEFAKPEPLLPRPPQFPSLDRIFTAKYSSGAIKSVESPSGVRKGLKPDSIREPRTESQPEQRAESHTGSSIQSRPEFTIVSDNPEAEEQDARQNDSPKYQKGTMEQTAYELLIQSNGTIADIVKGDHPLLRFKSWDAAKRETDTYWVRLKLQLEKNPEQEYIWVVKIQTKEVTPLNFNAKSIS